jgi:hypothetical protein
LNTVYAPSTVTTAETFLWYRPHPRLSLGLAHLWKQNAVRYLAAANLVPQTARSPGLNASAGVQGIGTGNPGLSVTAEKDWSAGGLEWNVFAGVGFRSNESHPHGVGGAKLVQGAWSIGVQLDGHNVHPFVIRTEGPYVAGFYLIGLRSPAAMVGMRF